MTNIKPWQNSHCHKLSAGTVTSPNPTQLEHANFVAVENKAALKCRLLLSFFDGVVTTAGAGVRESLHARVVLASGDDAGWQTEGGGGLGDGGVRPDDHLGRAEGSRVDGSLEGRDLARTNLGETCDGF
jgi:hypothetical protein